MKKVVHKFFWVWDFDKEEKWLNEMAAKGLALTSVSFCRYEFEDSVPGEYKICIEFLDDHQSRAEREKYISFFEETGAEHVGTYYRWVYFRKKAAEEFAVFSDNTSRIRHLNRIIYFVALLSGLNLYLGCYNLFILFHWHTPVNAVNAIGIVNLLLAALGAFGTWRLCRKRKRLKAEQQIFE